MAHKFEVTCNNCGWQGYEDNLSLIETDANDILETPTAYDFGITTQSVRLVDAPTDIEFIKGCPICLTDAYLSDIE